MRSALAQAPGAKLSEANTPSLSNPANRLATAARLVPLWALIIAQLNPQEIEYRTPDIARLLGITSDGLRKYCRQLWPGNEGRQYFPDFDEAAVLIYRVCRDGRRLPEKDALYMELLEKGIISPDFPLNSPSIERAERAIKADRQRRADSRDAARPATQSRHAA